MAVSVALGIALLIGALTALLFSAGRRVRRTATGRSGDGGGSAWFGGSDTSSGSNCSDGSSSSCGDGGGGGGD
jgi:hypothetical protein